MHLYYDVHTHNNTSPDHVVRVQSFFPDQLQMMQRLPDVWYSVGWHPWHVDADRCDEIFTLLETAIQNEKVIALGETGLDRSIETPITLQHDIFSRHLSLAQKAGMPVIVHAVKSYPDIIRAYKETKADVPMIIHGFRGNQQSAEQLLRHGFYLSFGAALLKQNSGLEQVFQNIPSGQLFLETDDTSTDIRQLYERAAVLRNLEPGQLMEIIGNNFKNCFGK